jgi:hypothetical protein
MKTGTEVHPVTNSTFVGALLLVVKRPGNVAPYSRHFVPLLGMNGGKTQPQRIDFIYVDKFCLYVFCNSLQRADYN